MAISSRNVSCSCPLYSRPSHCVAKASVFEVWFARAWHGQLAHNNVRVLRDLPWQHLRCLHTVNSEALSHLMLSVPSKVKGPCMLQCAEEHRTQHTRRTRKK